MAKTSKVQDVMAAVKANDAKVLKAMKAAGAKVGQVLKPGQLEQIHANLAKNSTAGALHKATALPRPAPTVTVSRDSTVFARARKGAAYRTKTGAKAGREAEVKSLKVTGDTLSVVYGDGQVAEFKAVADDLTPSVKNPTFIGFPLPKNPKAAGALQKAKDEAKAAMAPAVTVVKGKAPKAAPVQRATKGPGANKGAKGEAFCSKCGRDNGRPASPDCRNGAACKARVTAGAKPQGATA